MGRRTGTVRLSATNHPPAGVKREGKPPVFPPFCSACRKKPEQPGFSDKLTAVSGENHWRRQRKLPQDIVADRGLAVNIYGKI